MTIDEFISRLESLKTVPGVDGKTQVAIATDGSEWEFEIAAAEVQNVVPYRRGTWALSKRPEENTTVIVRIM